MEPVISEEDGSTQQINYITLPYMPMLSQKLRRELKKI